jgi:fermentation-respiration switch protein FrsA (DUF1100 family)
MTLLKWLFGAAIVYCGLVTLMYVAQRSLMYFPDPTRYQPASVGLPEAAEVVLDTVDGEKVIAWHAPPRGDKPVVIYFQGNGGGLNLRVGRFRQIVANGLGLVALCYRGFGGSSGKPTEAGLLHDAAAAYAFTAGLYPADRIVLWGESLGTGVAVALAADHRVARVLLESPFTSAVDVAAATYGFVPVRWLMKDTFRSDQRVGKISVPVLVVHGSQDTVIPIGFGERLYALIRAPKGFVRLAGANHNDHDEHGIAQAVRSFLAGSPAAR